MPPFYNLPGASLVIRQLSHSRGSADTIWLLNKGMEEIHTSTRAVHILLGKLEAGLWVSERLGQPALLQAVNNRLLLGPGIWGEDSMLVIGVCLLSSTQPLQRPRALQGPQCKLSSVLRPGPGARDKEEHNSSSHEGNADLTVPCHPLPKHSSPTFFLELELARRQPSQWVDNSSALYWACLTF